MDYADSKNLVEQIGQLQHVINEYSDLTDKLISDLEYDKNLISYHEKEAKKYRAALKTTMGVLDSYPDTDMKAMALAIELSKLLYTEHEEEINVTISCKSSERTLE